LIKGYHGNAGEGRINYLKVLKNFVVIYIKVECIDFALAKERVDN